MVAAAAAPGRQALQGFVQAFGSVIGVCCGERNIWSVAFRVAVTFSVYFGLQAQPVIAVSLLPAHTDTPFKNTTEHKQPVKTLKCFRQGSKLVRA